MQCFKLVSGGFVDKVIVFDELPERLLKNIKTIETAGFPRAWAKWLESIGSLRPIFKTETSVDLARNWTYKYTPIGKEPCFFVLDYVDVNADKEKWREICEYVRTHVGMEVRLKEKIEDMALALAPNCTTTLSVEPEDIMEKACVPLPKEKGSAPVSEIVKPGEQIIVQETAPKKRGRPKKVAVEA